MDHSMGEIGRSRDEDTQNSQKGKISFNINLNPAQATILEKYFMRECQHPSEAQRQQLAKEVGLEPTKIKFWFQNMRTQLKGMLNHEVGGSSSDVDNNGKQIMGNYNEEKTMVSQIAAVAMEELVRLIKCKKEPLWIHYPTAHDDKFTLHKENYQQIFPKTNHVIGTNVCKVSSKYSAIVNLSCMQLVGIFLDSVKWADMFPTIITKAQTTKVFENGSLRNRDGALQLMYEEMHILSPLVGPHEFNIVRYCKQVDVGVWIITDVSIASSQLNAPPLAFSWKHPSGCMIREIHNGACEVTWVEHVDLDVKIHKHHQFRDFVGTYNLCGAETWIKELQRMCNRSISSEVESIFDNELGVIQTVEGRQNVMNFANRMVKMFCECLTMSNQMKFTQKTLNVIGGIRLSIRETGIGEPNGMVIVAASTIWLPQPSDKVIEFLTDPIKRPQWDVLSDGDPVNEIVHISNGLYPENFTSIIRPFDSNETGMVILHESFTSPFGSYLVYAPMDTALMNVAISGEEDLTLLEILPCGFVVSPICPSNEGNNNNNNTSGAGSLLTLAYQIFVADHYEENVNNLLNAQNVDTIVSLLTTTLKSVKDGLVN
uniref:Homeobox-leucine zipper protein HDG11-like isoform X2 n=1 Tax=Cicer arietinum TaxID=3827 RepID=A0A3Q7XJC3_CICAR|nr:homeobox-leucine zipper protein HDG11-like isoform X2 [Cicer arietinum]